MAKIKREDTLVSIINWTPIDRLASGFKKRPFWVVFPPYELLNNEFNPDGPFTWNVIEEFAKKLKEDYGNLESFITKHLNIPEAWTAFYYDGEEAHRIDLKYIWPQRHYYHGDIYSGWMYLWCGNNTAMNRMTNCEHRLWNWFKTTKDGQNWRKAANEWWKGRNLNEYTFIYFMAWMQKVGIGKNIQSGVFLQPK